MKIKVNGEEKFIDNSNKELTLTETLIQLGYKNNTIIVEFNYLIINNQSWQ